MQKDLYNRLLEFELDNDIFDTSEYDRTIEHVKEELKNPKDIKQYIDYPKSVIICDCSNSFTLSPINSDLSH